MKFTLPYGRSYKEFTLPDQANVTVMEAQSLPPITDIASAFKAALNTPLGCPRLEDMPPPSTVAIAVADETRVTPTKKLLPLLFERIFAAWPLLKPENVVVIIGGGLHPPTPPDGVKRLMPEDMRGCRVAVHDPDNSPLRLLGTTKRGTPVELNALYADAQCKMVIGTVDPHMFVGFAGGSKGAIVGCASRALITNNHGLLRDHSIRPGNMDSIMRQDLNDAGDIAKIDFSINVVMDPHKNILQILAGHHVAILHKGAETSRQVYGIAYEQPFDVVIAATGGFPKDINLYQSQKSLYHLDYLTQKGGKILLLTQCEQGVGSPHLQSYMQRFKNKKEVVDYFESTPYVAGEHKGYLFARSCLRNKVGIVTDLDANTLQALHLEKAHLQPTIDAWYKQNPQARIAIVPNASTMFFYQAIPHETKYHSL